MVIGIDEVGRGAWAGPLVVGAVSLSRRIDGLDDSKKITTRNRKIIAKKIYKYADFIGIGWADSSEVDDYGLSAALVLASRRAVKDIDSTTKIIIDGNVNFLVNEYPNSSCLINADSLVRDVSAASIIAKVARDQYMSELALKFQNYGFEKHVGYGTKLHRDNIMKSGLCPEHRISFKPITGFLNGYS